MAWYSGVSGGSSARKGLPGSKARPKRNVFGTAPNRRHWPFRSGYFESSKAAAAPIDIMSPAASAVTPIELRKRMGVLLLRTADSLLLEGEYRLRRNLGMSGWRLLD